MSPEEATINALVEHLGQGLGEAIEVLEGWPEGRPRDLDVKPRVTVSQVGEGRFEYMIPEVVEEAPLDDGTIAQDVAWAEGRVTVQIDAWAAYRVKRDEVAADVEELLENQLPLTAALILATAYHGQDVRFDLMRSDRSAGARGPGLSEWRATWMLRAFVRRLKTLNTPAQSGGATITLTS